MRLRNNFSYVTLLIVVLVFRAQLSVAADMFPATVPLGDIGTSRTFQGELKGAPERYTFTLRAQQTFYANILVPDADKQRKDFLVEVISERGARYAMDGAYFLKWTPLAGPDGKPYLKGPEIAPTLYPGTYGISVSNADNHGTYVLVIGNAPGNPDIPRSAAKAIFIAKVKPIIIAVAGLVALIAAAITFRRIIRARNVG